MKYQKYEGVIIKKTPYRDADYFLTILTKDSGKMSCFARGVRTITSKRIGSLELFSKISFEVISKGERKTLTHVETINGFRDSKQHLHNISRLFQIGELIDALVPDDEHTDMVYELLVKALEHLDKFETPEYMNRFKLRLLKELGFGTPVGEIDDYIEYLTQKPLRARLVLN